MIAFKDNQILCQASARVTTTFICAAAVTVLWISADSVIGSPTFLALTFRELAFPASTSLGTYFEASVLNILAILLSIVHCNVGIYLASMTAQHYGSDSSLSEGIPLIFLVTLIFLAGVLKSSLPRLTTAARMACITAVFKLTSEIGARHINHHAWTDFILISSIASTASLIGMLLFMRNSTKSYPHEVVHCLSVLRGRIRFTVESTFPPKEKDKQPFQLLNDGNITPTTDLHRAYTQAFFEIHYNRLHIKEIRSFTHIIQRLRTELSWGKMVPAKLHSLECAYVYTALGPSAAIMSNALCDAVDLLEHTIAYAFDVPWTDDRHVGAPVARSYRKSKVAIVNAVTLLKQQLATVHEALDRFKAEQSIVDGGRDSRVDEPRAEESGVDDVSRQIFALSLFSVSLLQLAADITTALDVGSGLLEKFSVQTHQHLWLPKLTKAWFRSNPATVAYEINDFNIERFDRDLTEDVPDERRAIETEEMNNPTSSNAVLPSTDEESDNTYTDHAPIPLGDKLKRRWDLMISSRRKLSKRIHTVKHSRHLHYGLKNAIGAALLSLPAFLPADQGGRWFQQAHGQWAVITYIYVLETNTGATIRTGGLRLLGTIGGALFAYVACLISHQNPYAIVILMTLAELPISWLILCTSVAPIGTVASITMPPILFTNLHRHPVQYPTIELAANRAAAISIGILAAVLMNHFMFPRHCRSIFGLQTSKTIGRLTELYIALSRQTIRLERSGSGSIRKTRKIENEIEEYLFRMNTLIDAMHMEISILPKPLKTFRRLTRILHRCLDVLVGLRRVRDHIPRETVEDLISFRRDVISCICVALFACKTTFCTGQRLPQFLPSPQHALDALIKEKENAIHLRSPRQVSATSLSAARGQSSLSVSFALAENALLADFVSLVQEVLDIGRELHGVDEWFEEANDAGDEEAGLTGQQNYMVDWPEPLLPSAPATSPSTPRRTNSLSRSPTASLHRWI